MDDKVRLAGQKAMEKKRREIAENPELAPLNSRQEAFAEAFVLNEKFMGNATQCYALVYSDGYSTLSTRVLASELKNKPNVQKRIRELKAEQEEKFEILRHANIETLINIRDVMVGGMHSVSEKDAENGDIVNHKAGATAIRSIEVLNKMLGHNKAEEKKVAHEGEVGFVFNLVKPEDKKIPDVDDVLDAEVLDEE